MQTRSLGDVSPIDTAVLGRTARSVELKIQGVLDANFQPGNHRRPIPAVVVLLIWASVVSLFSIPDLRASWGSAWESVFANYPPGCATVPDVQSTLYGDNAVKFFEGRMALVNARKPSEKLDAIVAAYRVGCADSNRSVIWVSFSIPPELDSSTLYQMPRISFRLNNGWRPYASLSREPGGTQVSEPIPQNIGNHDDYAVAANSTRRWVYILDLDPVTAYWDGPISPEEYNGRFRLQFYGPEYPNNHPVLEVEVPATAELLSPNAAMPLNGRLSGNWVIEGAVDQGIMLAVSELVPASIPAPDEIAQSKLLLFLSWYTFDANGKPIWLTGSVRFLPGESEATLLLDLVSQGKFMGESGGQRKQAGSVNLRAISCGQIDVDYDLSGVGLGSGTTTLKRLFSLEIAEYGCSEKSLLQGEDS